MSHPDLTTATFPADWTGARVGDAVCDRVRTGSPRFVVLDRDGTINAECGYISSPDQVELLPGLERRCEKCGKWALGWL